MAMKIKVFALSLLFSFGFAMIAEARTCTVEYAIGYAQASNIMVNDQAACLEMGFDLINLPDDCIHETIVAFNSAQNALLNSFSICCCSMNLHYCCN
jgi:hypothetical protein